MVMAEAGISEERSAGMVEVSEALNAVLVEAHRIRREPEFQDGEASTEDMAVINRIAPQLLQPGDVYIRSMFLCSSQPCEADGCCFTRAALEQIAARVVGKSVLTGHDRTSLPLARFYRAAVVQKRVEETQEPVDFVRAWFYWLRETSGAKDLLLNIDGGIYREVSLAWRYHQWRCSLCGEPNGRCAHRVGEVYPAGLCFRLIDQVAEVLEGSLVYKSADQGTFLSGARGDPHPQEAGSVLLLCEPSDPLPAFLQKIQVGEALVAREDGERWMEEGVEYLWIRIASPSLFHTEAERFLCEGGVCLGELATGTGSDPLFADSLLWHGKETSTAMA